MRTQAKNREKQFSRGFSFILRTSRGPMKGSDVSLWQKFKKSETKSSRLLPSSLTGRARELTTTPTITLLHFLGTYTISFYAPDPARQSKVASLLEMEQTRLGEVKCHTSYEVS